MLTEKLRARIVSPAQMIEKWKKDLTRLHELQAKPIYRLTRDERVELIKLRRLRRGVR